MSQPRISLIIHTASADNFLTAQGIPSYFKAVMDNLRYQTFDPDKFELIYVDTFYEENKEVFRGAHIGAMPFTVVKHVPVHRDHRYWYDQGYCYISAAKNTGILYADGELCISCDDAEFFPEQFLSRYWDNYQVGVYLHAVHKRMKSIQVKDGLPTFPIKGDVYINDHRWKHVQGDNRYSHQHGSLCFAGTSFSLEDALFINGYNERMDGCKSLEDCDFAGRLVLLDRRFLMEAVGHLYIVDHPNYADMNIAWGPLTETEKSFDGQTSKFEIDGTIKPNWAFNSHKKIENFIAVENYGVLRASVELLDPVANKGLISPAHFKIIQRETIKYRQFDPLGEANKDKMEIWTRTPTFDLKQQRAELRASADWRW